MSNAPTQFDFWYAVNNTAIVIPPRRHLETFGNTLINYVLVSELMDCVGKVRIRTGRFNAYPPRIMLPEEYATIVAEGFGDEARKYLDWLRDHEDQVRLLQYGYTLKQQTLSETIVTDSIENVLDRIAHDEHLQNDPFSALVKGVDNPWDVCIVKLFRQVVCNSVRDNLRELDSHRLFELRDGLPAAVRDEIDQAFAAAEKDPTLVKPLGKMLKQRGLFDRFQDRFFALFRK
ncbi:MAG: hypothetical protein SPK06_08085 [Kiritimatiellia bacterium]|nr:hypothetical protein [Kiritimatiellia bacterium]